MIINDFEGWDLILLDPEFNEIQRLEGINGPTPLYRANMRTRVAGDDDYMLWFRGQSDISIVNIKEFSARHIHNFWDFQGQPVLGLCGAIDARATKLAGIGFIPHKGVEVQTIHVYDGGQEVSSFLAEDMIPDVEAWLCLEVSKEADVLFIGGTELQHFDYKGDAYLAAITFDEQPRLINFARYGDQDTHLYEINCLRRYDEGNVLFAGCAGMVAIVLWAGGQFHLINKIKNGGSSLVISDISYHHGAIYTVCEHGEGMVAYFDDRNYQGRDIRDRVKSHGNYRNLEKGRPSQSKRTVGDHYKSMDRVLPKYKHLFREYTFQKIGITDCKLFDFKKKWKWAGSRLPPMRSISILEAKS